MSLVTLTADTKAGQAVIRRVVAALRPESIGKAVRRTAVWTHGQLVQRTPRRWTGETRKAWRQVQIGSTSFRVSNASKVMLFLEEGTRAHGPVTSASRRPWVNDPHNIRYGHERVAKGKSFRAKKLYIPLTRKAALGGWSPGLRYGVDYVLVKWVRGIRARHIVRSQRDHTAEHLQLSVDAHIIGAINK